MSNGFSFVPGVVLGLFVMYNASVVFLKAREYDWWFGVGVGWVSLSLIFVVFGFSNGVESVVESGFLVGVSYVVVLIWGLFVSQIGEDEGE